jgi:hypothetical protein
LPYVADDVYIDDEGNVVGWDPRDEKRAERSNDLKKKP